MSATAAAIAKAAAVILSDERGRKAVGWILVAALSPLILIIAVLCSLGSGGAEHNNTAVKACFYGSAFTEQVPAEYQSYVTEMRSAFSLLDSAATSVNAQAEDGSLDAIRVKAVFYALCFGEDAPSRRAANHFVECFYTTETRTREVEVEDEETGGTTTEEEEYTVTVPLPLATAYANVAALLRREISEEDYSNINHIYTMIAGPAGGVAGLPGGSAAGGSHGWYERGSGNSTGFDGLALRNPSQKNAADLVRYVTYAWENGWGYVWGTTGAVLTQWRLDAKAAQYPEGVGNNYDVIQSLWLNRRTTDCVGLIKSYGWYDPEEQEVKYGTNGMPDYGANQMYYTASESGTIDTIPEIPGLAVWCDGHIGVYIGNGEVIEALNTEYGIVRTQLQGRGFTHWLKIAYIRYD